MGETPKVWSERDSTTSNSKPAFNDFTRFDSNVKSVTAIAAPFEVKKPSFVSKSSGFALNRLSSVRQAGSLDSGGSALFSCCC